MVQYKMFWRDYGQMSVMAAVVLLVFCLSWGLPEPNKAFAQDSGLPGEEKIPVIAYHDVLPYVDQQDAGNPSVLSLSGFAAQMEYLHLNGYYTASMGELEDHVKGVKKLPSRTVVITFDDGYESNYLYCYPLLKKYSFKATIFIMGSVPEKARPHLTWLQIRNMTSPGMVQIGSHTYDNHRRIDGMAALRALPVLLIKKDFDKFNFLCSKMGIPRPYFMAYPYGEAGPEAVEAASLAGYRLGFTIEEGYVRPGDPPMFLKRFNIGPDMDMDSFANLVSGGQDVISQGEHP